MYTLEISTDNDAFVNDTINEEIASLLEKAKRQLETGNYNTTATTHWGYLLDTNGNPVGQWSLK